MLALYSVNSNTSRLPVAAFGILSIGTKWILQQNDNHHLVLVNSAAQLNDGKPYMCEDATRPQEAVSTQLIVLGQ